MPPPAHLAHGGVVSLVGIQLVLDELRQHGVVFVVPAEGGGGNGPFPLSPGNLVSPRVPPRAPLCLLTRGTARPGTPSAWRTAWRSAPPAAPGSGSSSGPCGGCKSSGRSRPNPGSRPGERSGRALSRAGPRGHQAIPGRLGNPTQTQAGAGSWLQVWQCSGCPSGFWLPPLCPEPLPSPCSLVQPLGTHRAPRSSPSPCAQHRLRPGREPGRRGGAGTVKPNQILS